LLEAGCVVPRRHYYDLRPLSTACHFPGRVIDRHAPVPTGRGEEGLSSSTTPFCRSTPLRRRVFGVCFQDQTLHGLEPATGSAPLSRCSGQNNDAQASRHACGRTVAPPASTQASRPTPGVSLPGPWRLRTDLHRLAAVSLCSLRHEVVSFLTPECWTHNCTFFGGGQDLNLRPWVMRASRGSVTVRRIAIFYTSTGLFAIVAVATCRSC